MSGLVGQTLGRYEIVAFVGSGGMGEVYRARDTELGREVAVKILPPEAADVGTRLARFKREARAIAQLSHPNILDIHDFGADDGVLFSVTELLEGVDLRQRLRGHPLPISKVVSIGRAVAEGLAAAHSKGIVHRDIKPANIFITHSGQIKVLDFGIAGLRQSLTEDISDGGSDAQTLTQEGQVVGTPDYMSPEQITGKPVDARSDIFSLGCVLYEMLTGKRPFAGATSGETKTSIVARDPAPLAELRPDVPAPLDRLVCRCLEKEPNERFESARDLAFALAAVSEERPVADNRSDRPSFFTRRNTSIAVVSATVVALLILGGQHLAERRTVPVPTRPEELHIGVPMIEVSSDDVELRQLAAGLSLVLANGLIDIEQNVNGPMWVVDPSRASAEGASSCGDFFRLFNTSVCLESTLERSGDRLTLTLNAIGPAPGTIFGSATIGEAWGNLSRFQTAPIHEAASLLDVSLDENANRRLERSITNVTPALVSFLRGSGVLLEADDDEQSLQTAVDLLDNATQLDPLYLAAWERLAEADREMFEKTTDRDWLDAAFRAINESLSRTPSCRAYMILSTLHRSDGNSDARIEALERAAELEPRSAPASDALGVAYESARRNNDAERAFQRAINLRPGYWFYHHQLAHLYLKTANYDAAANHWRFVTRFAPHVATGYVNLAIAYWYLGDEQAVERALQHSIELQPENNYEAYSNLGTLYFGQARYADAVSMFEKALAEDDSSYIVWGNLGFARTQGADPELAVEPLRRAIAIAQNELDARPDDLDLLTHLASYHAMLGEQEPTLAYIDRAIALDPADPDHEVTIGEAYLDIGRRDDAVRWVRRAMQGGMPEERLVTRPELRELIEDARAESNPGARGADSK